jgi:hypothetical protein
LLIDQRTDARSASEGRILLFSHRNLYEQEAWRGPFLELERALIEVDAVDIIAPKQGKWFHQRKRNAQRIGKYTSIGLNPGAEKVSLEKDYALLVTVCEKPSELLNLNAVKNWRERSRVAICWMTEFYEHNIPYNKSVLKTLLHFDFVLFTFTRISAFKSLLGRRVTHLPYGVDTIKFCPYPQRPQRFIDVLSIGGRAHTTHKALLRMAKDDGILYVYDTLKDLAVYDVEEHRLQLSNLAKRSRYFIVNPGSIDEPEKIGGQLEFGPRYFEGLASGTILLGDQPKNNKEFDRMFYWPDAVVHVPYGSENIREVIRELDKDLTRQEGIRYHNIAESLSKHDWVHRWESVLNLAQLEPLPKLMERKQRLADILQGLRADSLGAGVQVG